MSEISDNLTEASVQYLLQYPEFIGHEVGFKDLIDLHGQWIWQMIYGKEDYTLQAHRGAYKSSCLAIALPLFMLLFPNKNVIFLRKTDHDVTEMMNMVAKVLQSDIIKHIAQLLYGIELVITEQAQDHISTNLWNSPMGAPQLRGLGIKSSITGAHAWLVVTDDICNISDRLSKAERDLTKYHYAELQNIRNRGGRIINLGTPWHKEDVFSKMPNIHRYDCYTTGLISPEKLQELRNSMTPSLFAANYELRHIAEGDALFTSAPQFIADLGKLRDGICHVDAAYGGSDFTAFTCAKYADDHIYLYGRLWQAHIDKVLSDCIAIADQVKCWPMYLENNGDKGFVFKEVRRLGKYSKGYHEDENKFIKISTYLRKWWPKIIFIAGTDPDYINQILDFTVDAEHDDAPDSAACVCRILDKRGLWKSS